MIESYERAMSDEERHSLELLNVARVPSRTEFIVVWTFAVVWYAVLIGAIAAIIIGVVALLKIGPITQAYVAILLIASAVFLTILFWLLWTTRPRPFANRRQRKAGEELIAAELANGRVRVKRVVADRVITIDQFEDEGEAMIFAIGERQSFILFRQVITPEDDTADWPAAEFELVSSCYDDGELGIFATNRPLKPTLELDWTQFTDETVYVRLDVDEAVIDQTPEEVIASWGYDPDKPSTMGDCFL